MAITAALVAMKAQAIMTAIFGIFESFAKIPYGIGIPLVMKTFNSQTLGLELVKLLAKQLNGKMEIDGTLGTKVKIIFPNPKMSVETENKERID